jgi:hypothetical protein
MVARVCTCKKSTFVSQDIGCCEATSGSQEVEMLFLDPHCPIHRFAFDDPCDFCEEPEDR